MSTVQVGKIIEVTQHPFAKGSLTADGVQWSTEATSSTNTYALVEDVTIDEIGSGGGPGAEGTIIEAEFSITWAQKCDGVTDSAVGKVQARNKGGAWVDLMTEVTNTTAGTTYEEKTYSGRFKPETNFNKYPFDIQVLVKSSGITNNGVGKTKNSSYVIVRYKIA